MKSKRLFYIDKLTQFFLESAGAVTKVEDIAAAIGVTKKTLYNYFESKSELVEAVLDTYIRRRVDEYRRVLTMGYTPIDMLVRLGDLLGIIREGYYTLLSPFGTRGSTFYSTEIYQHYRADLLEIAQFSIKKGVNCNLFESDTDVKLVGQFYLLNLEMLSDLESRHYELQLTEYQRKQMLFNMLKGNCTLEGLSLLRHTLDLKVLMV